MIKRKFATKLLSTLLILITVLSFPVTLANAANIENESDDKSASEIVTRAEQIEYYFRYYNGKRQYRIWSITFGKWKTDWIYG